MAGRTFMDRLAARNAMQAAHRAAATSGQLQRVIEAPIEYPKIDIGLLCETRGLSMMANLDSITNNTDCVLRIETLGGDLVQVLEPGRVYAPEEDITVRVRSNKNLMHRTYFNDRI